MQIVKKIVSFCPRQHRSSTKKRGVGGGYHLKVESVKLERLNINCVVLICIPFRFLYVSCKFDS